MAICGGIALVISAIATASYFAAIKGPLEVGREAEKIANQAVDDGIRRAHQAYDLAKRIGSDLDQVIHFRPKITTGGTTVIEPSQGIAELSLLEESFDHTYSWEQTWLNSTKRLKLKGHFVAKVGYDLTKPHSIDVSADGRSIRATMPPAQINSVEQTHVEFVQDEDGIWNKITPQERQNATNALLAEAKRSLDRPGLLSKANDELKRRLEGVVRKNAPTASLITLPASEP
jgi:hypothetical protein